MIAPTEKKRLLAALKENHVVLAACHKTGIGKSSYYRWRENDSKFAQAADDAIREGIELINDAAEGAIIGAIKAREVGASKFWLQHNHPRYKPKVEVSGTVEVSKKLSPEQEAIVRKALKMASFTKG
jgi:hypothetical protein